MLKRRIIFIVVVIMLVALVWGIGSGMMMRTDVYLERFTVSEDGKEITLEVAVTSSAGYVRAVADRSDSPERQELYFYSAFGGLNGSIAATDKFVIPINNDCEEIYFYQIGGFELVLKKDPATNEWTKM